jgi:hypothetical protein
MSNWHLNQSIFFCEGLLPGTLGFFNLITAKSSKDKKLAVKNEIRAAKLNADNAFNFLFQSPKSGATCEIVVAHGNVIRCCMRRTGEPTIGSRSKW